MRSLVGSLLVSLLLCALTVPGLAAGKPMPATQVAAELTTALGKSDYKAASARFDATMKKNLPLPALKGVWENVQSMAGTYRRKGRTRSTKIQGYDIAYVLMGFEKTELDCKVVVNKKGQVAGLFFVKKGAQ